MEHLSTFSPWCFYTLGNYFSAYNSIHEVKHTFTYTSEHTLGDRSEHTWASKDGQS